MNKYILPVLLIIAMLFFAFAFYMYSKDSSGKTNSQDKLTGNLISENNAQDNADSADSKPVSSSNNAEIASGASSSTGSSSGGGGGAGGGAGGGSSGGGGSNPTPLPQNKTLPADINESECGYYYEGYGVCRGVCPEGICISEERSCYCRK